MSSKELMYSPPVGEEYTVPKTKQISESIGEEVLWRTNFSIIRGNES
jgi:hypothetical protein